MTTGCLVLHPGSGVREHWAQARLIRAHTGCGWGPRPSTGIPPVSWTQGNGRAVECACEAFSVPGLDLESRER